MSTVPTLYSICFDYIKTHTQDLTCLDGVPYKPLVENIIKYLFNSDIPLNSSILSVIPHSHSKALRSANYVWTQLVFENLVFSIHPMLTTISLEFPKFITHLKMGATDLCDEDMYLLSRFTNLQVLNLQDNQNITDRSVSFITTMALNISNGKGLPYLEKLYLDRVKGITDNSLKFFGKMTSLSFVSLTGTQITPNVANVYLCSQGYLSINSNFDHTHDKSVKNYKLYSFIEKKSYEYQIPPGRVLYNTAIGTATINNRLLEFIRKITHATVCIEKRNIPAPNKIIKKQKLNTSDFLAMIESEVARDGAI